MTQYFAVVDNQEFTGRSKFASDYVFYGTAKQCAAEVTRVSSRDDNKGVTVYKVKNTPKFVDEADLDPRKDAQGYIEQAKGKVLGLGDKLGLPKTREEAIKRRDELKQQVIQEGTETATAIASGLVVAYQMGMKDPKKLANNAKKGALAKGEEVKTRLKGFFDGAKADAKALEDELRQDGQSLLDRVIDRVVGPDVDAVRTAEGQRVVRAAWLVADNNAEKVSLDVLAKATQPRPRKSPKSTGPK